MKSFRNGYFDDYIYQETINPDGRLKKGYAYRGIWYSFCDSDEERKRTKRLLAVAELISVISFAIAAVSPVSFNAARSFGALAGLSFVAHLAELWGAAAFVLSKSYITQDDYKSIDGRIMIASLIRICLLACALVCALIGTADWSIRGICTLLCYVLSLVMSAVIYRVQRRVSFHTYRNENGAVGSEY